MSRFIPVIALLGLLVFAGCEDPIPTDYIEEYVLTGYLFVDEPVQHIQLTRTLAPLDSFVYSDAAITDAQIRIWTDQDTFDLVYNQPDVDTTVGFYSYPDRTTLVEPGVTYHIEARLPDGAVLTSQTTTPERIAWVQAPKDTLQYPIDTLKLPSPDSLKLIWTKVPGVTEYLISTKCLDTLEYGQYLTPATAEKNRRIERFFEENAPRYNDILRWGFLQNTEVRTVWVAFKWFGLHEVTVYAPDPAMLEWYKQLQFGGNQYQSLLSNVEGGLGVFGSASLVRQTTFMLKNQP